MLSVAVTIAVSANSPRKTRLLLAQTAQTDLLQLFPAELFQ